MGRGMVKIRMITTAAIMLLINGIAAKTLVVGGNEGWQLPSIADFYTNWASQQEFIVGDILEFQFTTGVHTVAVVTSKEAYDSCDVTLDAGALLITEGSYERTLTSSGQFYFFCTIGTHCDLGLKFPANVVSPTPVSAPSPAPSPDSGSDSPVSISDTPGPKLAPSPDSGSATPSPGPSPALAPPPESGA